MKLLLTNVYFPISAKQDEKKKSEKPKDAAGAGDKKAGESPLKEQSIKPELSTNRTQPSKSVKVKDDDDTVKHIESLKEGKLFLWLTVSSWQILDKEKSE